MITKVLSRIGKLNFAGVAGAAGNTINAIGAGASLFAGYQTLTFFKENIIPITISVVSITSLALLFYLL